MSARAIMFQGTGSDVGKSAIVAGLCRVARRRGIDVAPFKPQNMSNNAAACRDGGEIGRAQAVQARAARLAPHVDMNPVLLKPQSDRVAQVVVHGEAVSTLQASEYMASRDGLLTAVRESFDRLCTAHALVIVEGAGSPAEINLRARDIANMGFARATGTPVCLLGDIDRGGVIAAVVGTKAVIDADDAAMISAFAINKFRGDPRLFDDGVSAIEQRTGWPCAGVIPWLPAARRLPQEDAVILEQVQHAVDRQRPLRVAAPMLSRIANFDDLDPLIAEPSVEVGFIPPGEPIPRDVDVIVLLGTKSTLGDLAFLRAQGWDHDVMAHARAGGHVLGLCGGYQMLGTHIVDREGVDGAPGEAEGLGLLNVRTEMSAGKRVREIAARARIVDAPIRGYEIHMGTTDGADRTRPFARIGDQDDGAVSADGFIAGSYIHGMFTDDAFRTAWLERLRAGSASGARYEAGVEAALDELAEGLEAALDVDMLFGMARVPRRLG